VPPPSAPPAQTEEQLRAARARAQEARTVRAEVKAELRDGTTTFEQVLERAATDEHVNRLKVLALLESVPGLGKVKSRRLMAEIGIADSRRVRGLGPEQRKALLAALASRAS
jgi:hypothetical protein